MKTFFLDLIPQIKKFSQKVDDLTRLTNQHWVIIEEIENSKSVYIFRTNNELLISCNGIVEKAKWEYLGNNSLLIDRTEGSYLFKNGFFDENILALKVDGKEEYVFLINESKYVGELNSMNKIAEFLSNKYLHSTNIMNIKNEVEIPVAILNANKKSYNITWLETDKGKLEIRTKMDPGFTYGDLVFLDEEPASDGKYVYGWPSWIDYIVVKDGKVKSI